MKKIPHVADFIREISNVKIIEETEKKVKTQIIRGSNNIATIPCVLSKELSYIVAAILCDGHLKKDKYRIGFEVVNENILLKFIKNLSSVFEI
ncbi:MAG: hypothetical protein KAT35_02680, partial [Candidatus Aenigmarchaeota archaeon]|nr:hypothetical protein [Candidatus Aenigmarchaeota archaeon]